MELDDIKNVYKSGKWVSRFLFSLYQMFTRFYYLIKQKIEGYTVAPPQLFKWGTAPRFRRRYTVPPVVPGVEVLPVDVTGLNAKLSQYFLSLSEINLFVVSL